jgi:hypothetical protein
MRKLIIIAVLAFGMNVTAQTTTGNVSTNTTVQGLNTTIKSTYNTNIRGTLINIGAVGANDKTTISGYNTEVKTTYTSLNSTQTFVNGEKTEFRQGAGPIKTLTTISQAGISTAGSVTGSQIYTQGMEVGNEIINLKNGVNSKASQTSVTNLTNRVTTTETKINDLYDVKADKTQVAADIAQAKAEANAYTDTKVGALQTKVNTEVKRLDDRIDATNQNVTNLSNKVTTEVARVDSRIDATNKVVEANKKEAADATAKVQSNLDKEAKRLDMKIDTEIQKVESKFNQRITELDTRLNNRIDNVLTYVGNEFRAINNRIDGLGAMTVALSTAATSSVYNPEKPTNVNFATGYYGRAGALALGVSHFLSSNTKLSVNYAAGSFTKSAVGLGLGFCF